MPSPSYSRSPLVQLLDSHVEARSPKLLRTVLDAPQEEAPLTYEQLRQGALNGEQREKSAPTAPFSRVSDEDQNRLPEGLDDASPVTALQLDMLSPGELSRGSSVSHNVNHTRLQARFNRACFVRTLEEMIARHPRLRTAFAPTGFSEPLQLVFRDVRLPLEVNDLRMIGPAAQEANLKAWYQGEEQRDFDCTQPPLIRFSIHQLADDVFELGWSEHHAIGIGWSINSMIAELCQRYFDALNQGA